MTLFILTCLTALLLAATDASPRDRTLVTTLDGLSVFAEKGSVPQRLSYHYTAHRELVFEIPQYETVLGVRDINADGVLEVWTSHFMGDEVTAVLYQLDLRARRSGRGSVVPALSGEGSLSDPLSAITVTDLDGDGKDEILVKSPTHPTFGSLYQAGNVDWVDVYRLAPRATKVNARYPSVYRDKRVEITQELERLRVRRQELQEGTRREPQFVEVYELRIREVDDQVRVYQSWLKRIATILGEK